MGNVGFESSSSFLIKRLKEKLLRISSVLTSYLRIKWQSHFQNRPYSIRQFGTSDNQWVEFCCTCTLLQHITPLWPAGGWLSKLVGMVSLPGLGHLGAGQSLKSKREQAALSRSTSLIRAEKWTRTSQKQICRIHHGAGCRSFRAKVRGWP